ncbi:MAG: FAD-binding oxidoreductase [Acidobacteria bacterium]|nr:FAD-binding oxidoreductase [Acidobacteriota bacterium]
MILQNWWYTTLLSVGRPMSPPLKGHAEAEVAIVGGGMSGLCAALRLMRSGRRVALVERNICGGSSTGKSAGFLTPDSELELAQLVRRYGAEGARDLWEAPVIGIRLITEAARQYGFDCDLVREDSLFLGNGTSGGEAVAEEVAARERLGYPKTLYDRESLSSVIGSTAFSAAVRYPDTYGINPLLFAQGVKRALLEGGVAIYEGSEVTEVTNHTLRTHLGSLTADQIVFCADKLRPSVTRYARNVYHAQTFMAISEPLEDDDVRALFPSGSLQCWDSDLVYTYFRLTGDQRLLVGGGSALTTFSLQYVTSPRVITGVLRRLKRKIPRLEHVKFVQYWPGFIDTTRDLLPTVLKDERFPWIHYVLGCVGLPWAAFCGDFVARHVLHGGECVSCDDPRYYRFFTPRRRFLLPLGFAQIVGKPLVFALNNAWAKYYQVDVGRPIGRDPGKL